MTPAGVAGVLVGLAASTIPTLMELSAIAALETNSTSLEACLMSPPPSPASPRDGSLHPSVEPAGRGDPSCLVLAVTSDLTDDTRWPPAVKTGQMP